MHTPPSLRKAAILVNSLDRRSADALLDQMDPDRAALVRRLLLDLGDIDPGEQEAVIAEFMGVAPRGALPDDAGVELEAGLARRLADDAAPAGSAQAGLTPAAPGGEIPAPRSESPPFRFLHAAAGEPLARLLTREHPQTAAVVLSHLPAAQAAEVLRHLPPPLQVQVVRRVVDLKETSREILGEVEAELRSLLGNVADGSEPTGAGLAAMQAILAQAGQADRGLLLANLRRHDRALAARLQGPLPRPAAGDTLPAPAAAVPPQRAAEGTALPRELPAAPELPLVSAASEPEPVHFEFHQLAQLDNPALALILQTADPELVLLALAGAREELVRRILRPLPRSEAEVVRRRIEQQGPLRLRDVEQAQQAVARVAGELASRGRIAGPARKRFAAAA